MEIANWIELAAVRSKVETSGDPSARIISTRAPSGKAELGTTQPPSTTPQTVVAMTEPSWIGLRHDSGFLGRHKGVPLARSFGVSPAFFIPTE